MEWVEVIKILLFVNGQSVAEAPQWTEAVSYIETTAVAPEVVLAMAIVDTRMNLNYKDDEHYGAWKMRKGNRKAQDVIDFCGLDPDDCAHTQATYIVQQYINNFNKCKKELHQTINAHIYGVCSKDKEYITKVLREVSYVKQLRNNYEVK